MSDYDKHICENYHYNDYRSQAEICKECYNVLKKYLEGDSRKNENYLARFIEFFQTQVCTGR